MKKVGYMSQKIKENWKKNKKYISFSLILSFIIISNILFFTSYHNLDLLQNYSLLYNSFNLNSHCDSNALNIKEITDCTSLRYCPSFQSIYLNSKLIQIISYIILNFLLINNLIWRYKNAISKRT